MGYFATESNKKAHLEQRQTHQVDKDDQELLILLLPISQVLRL